MTEPICMDSDWRVAINWDEGEGRLFRVEFAEGPVGMSMYGSVSVLAVSPEDAVVKAKAKIPHLARVTDVGRSYRCLFETFSPTYSNPYDL